MSGETEIQRFRILSLYTGRNEGDPGDRLVKIRNFLRRIDASVCCFQEVFRAVDGSFDGVRELLGKEDCSALVTPTRRKHRPYQGVDSLSESCLVTCSPNKSLNLFKIVELSTSADDGQRVAQLSTIDVPGFRIGIVNLHLTFLPGESGDRLRKLQMLEIVREIKQTDLDFWILAGDYNAEPQSPLMQFLTSDPRFHFGRLPPGEMAPTAFGNLGNFGSGVEKTVDYICVFSENALNISVNHLDRAVFAKPDAFYKSLSDHAPVVVCMHFARP